MRLSKETKMRAIRPYHTLTNAYSVDDIKRMHRGYFFSPDTMRFFKSRLIQDVFPTNKGSVYFVTSEKEGFTNDSRVFNVREYNIERDSFNTISTFNSRASALTNALDLAYQSSINEVVTND